MVLYIAAVQPISIFSNRLIKSLLPVSIRWLSCSDISLKVLKQLESPVGCGTRTLDLFNLMLQTAVDKSTK